MPGYDITPGSIIMFPWLSGIALKFERYRFSKLKLHIVSKSPATTAGRIYAAIDYDYSDDPPRSLMEIMANHTAQDSSAWTDLTLEADPRCMHRDLPYKYTEMASRVASEPRTSYCGYFIVATDGCPANCNWDVYVEYVIDLVTPQLETQAIAKTGGLQTTQDFTGNGSDWILMPDLPVIGNNIAKVTAGSAVCPPLSILDQTVKQAYDISFCQDGLLNLRADLSKAGVTPSEILTTNRTIIKNALFDSAGTLLDISGWSDPSIRVSGPSVITSNSTAGATVTSTVLDFIELLRKKFPTLRYIVPFVSGCAALSSVVNKLYAVQAY